MIKKVLKRYNSHTPEKARKVGKIISNLGITLQAVFAIVEAKTAFFGPIPYLLVVLSIHLVSWLGYSITELSTDDHPDPS